MQKMPARSKLIIKHRRKDKDMDSKIIEIEMVKIEKLEEKTRHHQEELEENDRTRCWGPCPQELKEDELKKDVLEELEIT
jgi:hypothetical protein